MDAAARRVLAQGWRGSTAWAPGPAGAWRARWAGTIVWGRGGWGRSHPTNGIYWYIYIYIYICFMHINVTHIILSYHIISCHIMSYHVISCHIISCHVILYHIKSSDIMSCNNLVTNELAVQDGPSCEDSVRKFGSYADPCRQSLRCRICQPTSKCLGKFCCNRVIISSYNSKNIPAVCSVCPKIGYS